MKKSKTLIILSVVLVLVIGLFIISLSIAKSLDKPTDNEEETTVGVVSVEKDRITLFSYLSDGEKLTFTKNGDSWICREKNNIPINDEAVSKFVSALSQITSDRVIAEVDEDKLKEFGLDNPSNKISFTDNGQSTELLIGKENIALSAYYACLSDRTDEVYMISDETAEALSLPFTEMIKNDTLTKVENGNAVSVTITNDTGTRIFKYFKDGDKTDYTSVFNWYLSDNGGDFFPLEENIAKNLSTELAGMSLFELKFHDSSAKAECGLDNPVSVRIEYTDTDGNSRTQVLNLGNESEADVRYACIGDSCLIYTYSGTAVLNLIDKSTEELLTDRIFRPTWSYIKEICVTDGTKTANVGITANEAESTDNKDDKGNENTYTLNGQSSDYQTVIPLFNSLSGLKATKNVLTDKLVPTKEGNCVLSFTFTLDGEACPDSFVLEILDFSDDYFKIRADGRDSLLITAAEYNELQSLFEKIAE